MRTSGIAGQCSHALQVATTKYKVRYGSSFDSWISLNIASSYPLTAPSCARFRLHPSLHSVAGQVKHPGAFVFLRFTHSLTNSTYHVNIVKEPLSWLTARLTGRDMIWASHARRPSKTHARSPSYTFQRSVLSRGHEYKIRILCQGNVALVKARPPPRQV